MTIQRTLAWRRAVNARHRRTRSKLQPKAEKSWKLLYTRGVKLQRARQLGLPWPHREWLKLVDVAEPLHVLFVCSRNQWRSPTAEQVWRSHPGVLARSAGVSRTARRRLTVADLRWADLILVMEEKHKARIRAEHRDEVRYKAMHVLDIPDDYQFMQPELVEVLRLKVSPLIDEATRT